MYKLLIFDWDGTIIDSAARIISSMQQAARDLEQPELSDAAVRDIIGLGLPEAIRVLIPGVDEAMIPAMRERYGHYYLGVDETPTALFDGVHETLLSLKNKGYRLAVATGKSRRGLQRVFEDTGLEYLFEASRCADETTSKPDPHMLEEILAETGVSAADAVMIGDTEFDLEMAVRAGMDNIAASYGAHHIDRLRRYNPVLEMHAFPELESWLVERSLER
ncbi:HAD-IA family hydrolase [Amphritea sp. HPY]|uniref:HAD-IA family hydrolase n=1 Tax=Amphritea sp. HPY TaxID=3421652 RepID=UPI003D7EA57B